jgi:SAM-dependent methyltransferase
LNARDTVARALPEQDPQTWDSFAVAADGPGYVMDRVRRLLEGRTGRVLDAGAATGRGALVLARGGARVVAVEASPRAARYLHARAVADGERAVYPIRAAAEHLPFPDAVFDAAVAWPSLMQPGGAGHLAGAIGELERTVRAGGRVIVAGHTLGDELERLLPAALREEVREAEARTAAGLRGRGYREELVETAFIFPTVDEAERTMGALLGAEAAAYIGRRLMYGHVSPTVAHRVRLLWREVR